jgi:uncharacterized protein with HEPN domain
LPSNKPARRFQDILDNIAWILRDVGDASETEFLESQLLQDAVLFRLLRISEAASKLGALAEALAPDQPWQQIRSFGNALRHEYDAIALRQVWIIVVRDLPPLMSSCRAALAKLAVE